MSLTDVERGWRALLLGRDEALMEGADAARQRVYRRLVRANLTGAVTRGVPILRRLAGEDVVTALVARWLDEVAPTTRLVRFLPVQFAEWLLELAAREPDALPHPAAPELAHWEALEIDVVMAADAEPRKLSLVPHDEATVETHPSARLAASRHAVHTLTTSSTQWPAPAAEPVILLAWRAAERLTWSKLDGGTAKTLVETSGGATLGEAFARIEAALAANDALDRARVKAQLVDLCRRGALAGFGQ